MERLELTRREAYLLLLTEEAFAKGRLNRECPTFTARELAHGLEGVNRTMFTVRERDLAYLLNRMGVFPASRGPFAYRRKTRELLEKLPEWLEAAREEMEKRVCVIPTPTLAPHSNITR